jgi:hypothetical protein
LVWGITILFAIWTSARLWSALSAVATDATMISGRQDRLWDLGIGWLFCALVAAGLSHHLLRHDPRLPAEILYGTPMIVPAVRHSREPILQLDRTFRLVEVNPAAERLLGYASHQIRGMPITFLLASMARAQAQQWNQGEPEPGAPGRDVHSTPGAVVDFKRGQASETAVPQADVHSLTEQATASLSEHLMLINGYADLLLEGAPSASPPRHDLEQIRHAGERASLLVQQLPFLVSEPACRLRPLDLSRFLRLLEPRLRLLLSPGIEARFRLDGAASVRADPAQLALAVSSLVSEANRFLGNSGKLSLELNGEVITVEVTSPESGKRYESHRNDFALRTASNILRQHEGLLETGIGESAIVFRVILSGVRW